MKVGFIGLGTMGEPMAHNLLKAGFQLVVCDLNAAPVERLAAAGATGAASPAEVARQVEIVVSSLPDDAAVREVLVGEWGILSGGQPGLIAVDTSTISPLTSQSLAPLLAEKGIAFLEAPVSGGQTGAIAGTLAIMVGGARDAYEKALPVLQALGKNITHVGGHGSALTVKLCNQMIIGAVMASTSEALTMAAKAGIDTGLVLQILSNSTARGWIVQEYVPRTMLVENFKPGFRLALERKDVGLALDYGIKLGVPMFVTALVHQLYAQAQGLGKGNLDFAAICQLYTEAARVSIRKQEQGA